MNHIIKLLYTFLVFLLFSCGQEQKALKPVKVQEGNYFKLLSKFKKIELNDTLEVTSPADSTSEFTGTALDTDDILLFPENIALQCKNVQKLTGIYQFRIDSNRIGLLARTTSSHAAMSVKLFFFDKNQNRITFYIELAEHSGKEQKTLNKMSYLYLNEKKEVLAYQQERVYTEYLANDEKTSHKVQWYCSNSFTLLNLSKPRIETIEKNELMSGGYR